jgi:hypothetical protein
VRRVARDDETWDGVLIYEIQAKFVSASDGPKQIDPEAQGERLRGVIEEAIKSVANEREVQIGGVRYAGSRGSKRYS